MTFDWHGAALTRQTPITQDYRNTQNVRRFMLEQCGERFRFDRDFMAWIRSGSPTTLGEVVDEWLKRNA